MLINKSNKKGNIEDLFYLMAILFGLGLFFVIFYQVYISIQHPLGSNLNQTWSGADEVLEKGRAGIGFFDKMFPFLLIGMVIWVFISAYFIKTYPFMFFIAIFILAFMILLGVVFAKVHEEAIRNNAELSEANEEFKITGWIINRFPYIIVGVATILFIILYSKINTPEI